MKMFYVHLRKYIFCYCWIECSVYVCYVQSAYGVVQIFNFQFICSLVILATVENEVLKSSADIVDMSVSPFNSFNVCFMYLEALFCIHVFIVSGLTNPLSLYNVLLCFLNRI